MNSGNNNQNRGLNHTPNEPGVPLQKLNIGYPNSNINLNNQVNRSPQNLPPLQTRNINQANFPPTSDPCNQSNFQQQNPYYRQNPAQPQTNYSVNKTAEDYHEKEAIDTENYYTKTLLIAIIGICFYYLGAFLILFWRSDGDQSRVTLPVYEVSWKLFFSDLGLFFKNFFFTVFGYFIQYAKLFGFFNEEGDLKIEPRPAFLMPVDIIIKLITIYYFHFRWMPWDTKRNFEIGCFNDKYPYLTKLTSKKKVEEQIDLGNQEELAKEFNLNPHIDSQHQNRYTNLQANNQHSSQQRYSISNQDDEDDDEDDEDGLLVFDGVYKPLEEFYYKHEEKIYGFIRRNILPGSNLILALYFSALMVLDLREPLIVLIYVVGIMSLFWCMQTFLVILDHNQYPPEENSEN